MNFFGIGAGEIILVLLVALMIWGPKRLPKIARTLGKMTRTLKKTSFDLTSQITKELDIRETDTKEKPRRPEPERKSGAGPKKD